MLIAAEQLRELTDTQNNVLMVVGVLFVLAVVAVAIWEDNRVRNQTENHRSSLGVRLAAARKANCPGMEFIDKMFANGSLDYTDQLLLAEGF